MKKGILSTTFIAHSVLSLPPDYPLRNSYQRVLQRRKLDLGERDRSATALHTGSITQGCAAFTVYFTPLVGSPVKTRAMTEVFFLCPEANANTHWPPECFKKSHWPEYLHHRCHVPFSTKSPTGVNGQP